MSAKSVDPVYCAVFDGLVADVAYAKTREWVSRLSTRARHHDIYHLAHLDIRQFTLGKRTQINN